MAGFDKSLLREYCKSKEIPVTELIMQLIAWRAEAGEGSSTLFAACPNSTAVLKAGLIAAKRANAPIKFAATLNQVDMDGGYTTWTQEGFVRLVKQYAEETEFSGPIIIAMDHGGPWLKDMHSTNKWTPEQTMESVKLSFAAALFAGYDLLHVDPTVDRTLALGENIDIGVVVSRTVEIISFIEGVRRRNLMPKISYEVGTEEVHGGLANKSIFRRFLNGLKAGLANAGLQDVWPVFVVGKVGTDLDTTTFDPDVAKELVSIAREYGSYIKGHYTDYVSNPEAYPSAGMGAANIGPEFTEEEYAGLIKLVEMENELLVKGRIEKGSGFKAVLKRAVVDSGRWMKWRKPEEMNRPFEYLSSERQDWLVKTGCRYIWTHPEVLTARDVLYSNLGKNAIDAENIVLEKIAAAMMKYFDKFGLINLNDFLNSKIMKLNQ